MASWTDYLNPIADIGKLKNYFFDQPAGEQKAALGQAQQTVGNDTQAILDYYAKQQAAAKQNYKPLQNMFAQAYGTGGLMAPQLPKKPLGAMYGGG